MNIVKRYIKINNEGDSIEVVRAYSFLNDSTAARPKMTMAIEAPKESFTSAKIREIFSKDNDIYLYEDSYRNVTDENGNAETVHTVPLRTVYHHYFKNLSFSYSSATQTWRIEVDKKEDTEILAEANEEDLVTACEAIADLYESKTTA